MHSSMQSLGSVSIRVMGVDGTMRLESFWSVLGKSFRCGWTGLSVLDLEMSI